MNPSDYVVDSESGMNQCSAAAIPEAHGMPCSSTGDEGLWADIRNFLA